MNISRYFVPSEIYTWFLSWSETWKPAILNCFVFNTKFLLLELIQYSSSDESLFHQPLFQALLITC